MSGFFRLTELEGPNRARLVLKGTASVLMGLELSAEAKGGKSLPVGSADAILSASGLDVGQTEVQFVWAAQKLSRELVEAEGIEAVARPESLFLAFEELVARARLCLV